MSPVKPDTFVSARLQALRLLMSMLITAMSVLRVRIVLRAPLTSRRAQQVLSERQQEENHSAIVLLVLRVPLTVKPGLLRVFYAVFLPGVMRAITRAIVMELVGPSSLPTEHVSVTLAINGVTVTITFAAVTTTVLLTVNLWCTTVAMTTPGVTQMEIVSPSTDRVMVMTTTVQGVVCLVKERSMPKLDGANA